MQFRDLKSQYRALKPQMDEAIQAVLDSSDYIAGDQVEELEKELAEYVGVKNCVSCGNGTDALVLALKAWGIGAGDAVFVPDHTFFSSAESVAFVGATPVFADVHEDTFNVDVESMERGIQAVIKEGKLKPKAMVVVDLFGLPADYDKVLALAEKYGLYVLEDCAAYEAAAQRNRMFLALREAEIEERYRPEALTAEESDARMAEIFKVWGLDYA